jgi:hypothetical protein
MDHWRGVAPENELGTAGAAGEEKQQAARSKKNKRSLTTDAHGCARIGNGKKRFIGKER